MFELFKLLWDVVVLRDAARKGQLNWQVWVIAIVFVLFLYGTGLPAGLLYINHPQYKALFIATLLIDGLATVWMIIWGTRRYFRLIAASKASGANN